MNIAPVCITGYRYNDKNHITTHACQIMAYNGENVPIWPLFRLDKLRGPTYP